MTYSRILAWTVSFQDGTSAPGTNEVLEAHRALVVEVVYGAIVVEVVKGDRAELWDEIGHRS